MPDQSLGTVVGVNRPHSLPSRRRRQHDVLTLVRPMMEPPVQVREGCPDRRHLLNKCCTDVHLHVGRCQTGNEDCCSIAVVAWELAAKTSPLVLGYLCSIEGRVLQEHRVLQQPVMLLYLLLLRALQWHGEMEAARPSRRWSRTVWVVGTGMCLMGRKQESHGIQTGTGPRPIHWKFDGPRRAAAYQPKE